MTSEMLNKTQLCQVYRQRIRKDFRPEELKPLSVILRAVRNGSYVCRGFRVDGYLAGYAFLAKLSGSEDYLIDYMAVSEDRRGLGLGSEMLRLLKDELSTGGSLIGEVEDPNSTESEEEKAHRLRRCSFYQKNGFSDSGVRVNCFGVNYLIICSDRSCSRQTVEALYAAHYRAGLPEWLFRKYIRFCPEQPPLF